MIRAALALALLVPAGCAAPGPGGRSPAAEQPAYEAIAFEIDSWGRPLGNWEVGGDGAVRHMTIDGSPFARHRREHRAFAVDAPAVARLAALAAALPNPRPDRADCKQRATDLPYGTLRLRGGGREEAVSFDTGCHDAPYRAFVAQLRAMDDLVGEWAAQRPADRVEEVGGV